MKTQPMKFEFPIKTLESEKINQINCLFMTFIAHGGVMLMWRKTGMKKS